MRTSMITFVAAVALLTVSSVASAQYYSPPSWHYNVHPGGGGFSYTVSNGYETMTVTQSVNYGSGHYSINYRGPYGYYTWSQNYPTYSPTYYYPTYRYAHPVYRNHYNHHHHYHR